MDAEQHSRILLAMGKVLEGLVRESKEHQAAAKQALSESQKATKQLEAATSDYKQIATTLPDKVKTAIAESLNGAADIAGERLAANFSEADTEAGKAAVRYSNAARGFRWRVIAIVGSLWFFALVAALSVIWYTNEKVLSLQDDSRVLGEIKTYLKGNRYGAKIALCGAKDDEALEHRLCVYVQKPNKEWEWQTLTVHAAQH